MYLLLHVHICDCLQGTDASVAIFLKPGPNDGFEYARLPHLQYYPKAQTLFMARRRRWVRKMVPETKDVGALQQPVFYFKSKVCSYRIP